MTRIVVFAKQPLPGRVKTRLAAALGEKGAAELAADMLRRTVEEALATGLEVELRGDPDPALWYRGRPVRLAPQGGGDLGERLSRAAKAAVPVLLIGTDCPELDRSRLSAAAAALKDRDAVIHPALDGGYVLLGLRRFDASLFDGIAWSTASVAAETIARIRALGWTLDVRATLRDVDEPADLALVGRG